MVEIFDSAVRPRKAKYPSLGASGKCRGYANIYNQTHRQRQRRFGVSSTPVDPISKKPRSPLQGGLLQHSDSLPRPDEIDDSGAVQRQARLGYQLLRKLHDARTESNESHGFFERYNRSRVEPTMCIRLVETFEKYVGDGHRRRATKLVLQFVTLSAEIGEWRTIEDLIQEATRRHQETSRYLHYAILTAARPFRSKLDQIDRYRQAVRERLVEEGVDADDALLGL